ncbi:MAG: hypothetical protein JNJ63_10895 [Hyphomonadaceae bacterium]|nr:hypothetical protein [Hyphomonadaceae bacterium]
MSHLSIRDLQKISGETIGALEGPTPVKAGDRTIGVLIPLKVGDADKLAAVLKRAEQLAKKRDAKEDEKLLAEFGDIDPVNWSIEAVKKLRAEKF